MAERNKYGSWISLSGVLAILGVVITLLSGLRGDIKDLDQELHSHELLGGHGPMDKRMEKVEDAIKELQALHPRINPEAEVAQ